MLPLYHLAVIFMAAPVTMHTGETLSLRAARKSNAAAVTNLSTPQ